MEHLSMEHEPSIECLEFMINHVFLPPKLPQEDDYSANNDRTLSIVVHDALNDFLKYQCHGTSDVPALQGSIRMVAHMISSAPEGSLLETATEIQMGSMIDKDVLAFNIKAMNAALLIRRDRSQYTFETFEVSCPNAQVTGTQGRLRRLLPQEAIMISADVMDDPTFRRPFAEMLAKMDRTTPADACRVSRKAGKNLPEVRDVVDPRYFRELVFGILRGIGIPAQISRIEKRIQDEVLWSSSFCCWRRSRLWTVLRVALQTTFMCYNNADRGQILYKAFVIHFMTRLLTRAIKDNLHSDLVHTMHRKLVRRLGKLSALDGNEHLMSGTATWASYIRQAMSQSHDVLRQRWEHELELPKDPFGTQGNWNTSVLRYQDDTNLRIETLRPSLERTLHRPIQPSEVREVDVDYFRRIAQTSQNLPSPGILTCSSSDGRRILLCDVEIWVRNCLTAWGNTNLDRVNACSELSSLIDGYTKAAQAVYIDDQEGISRMFLTVMELWVCLDKLATRLEPLLLDYQTDFPLSVFDPLLLPLKSHMKRLAAVESYLAERLQHCRNGFPSIFSSFGNANSLPVRYFDASVEHQSLHETIEREAASARSRKLDEFRREHFRYTELLASASRVSHSEVTRSRWDSWNEETIRYTEHDPNCQKCRWINEASNMQIERHEWPLPSVLSEAKTVVFELNCPSSISLWRDTTYYLLVNILTPSKSLPRNVEAGGKYGLGAYEALRGHFVSKENRIIIASAAKPILNTHYQYEKMSLATEESICVEHAMRYDIYDSTNSKIARTFMGYTNIREQCSQPILDARYQNLQEWVDNTTHSPNEVIAKQSDCPHGLSIHEYLSFGNIRSGIRLQWQNVGRVLVDSTINLNHEAVGVLLSQTVWQVGPCSSEDDTALRTSHAILSDQSFCIDIVQSLDTVLTNTKENWQGIMSVQVLITLTSRILTLASDLDVKRRCFSLLSNARTVTLTWTRKLKEELLACFKDEERKQLMNAILEIALSCHSTFALDLPDIEQLLTSEEDTAILTECMITIDEMRPSSTAKLPRHMAKSIDRFCTTTQISETALCMAIIRQSNGLDQSVAALWKSYTPGTPWAAMMGGKNEWVVTKTAVKTESSSVPVHFNLLTGSLLVNGSPLTRLPRTYESNDTYQRLFSEMYISVIPSTMPGMRYESRSSIFGYQVHFFLDGSDLVIRTTKMKETFSILSTKALRGDFPSAFIDNYSHWLNHNTKELEFRPLTNPWEKASSNWTIMNLGSVPNTMSSDQKLHIDMHSPSAGTIHKVLSPIEHKDHIHISYTPITRFLDVHLPRLQLDFFVNSDGALECKQRRDMVVDSIQSCGTLTGLRNKLILRSVKDSSRSIIIPFGPVTSTRKGHHVEVQIDLGIANEIGYLYYELDVSLHRLKDNDTLKSCLFRTLLHAKTSHCLPDLFTGRTGTEQAIINLREARTLSFRTLEPEETRILELIARLTPRRLYYPREMRVMQEVEWDTTIPPLSQHESFSQLVSTIFQHAREQDIFYPTGDLPTESHFGELSLLSKAAARNSIFRGLGFGAEQYITQADIDYHGPIKTKEPTICGLARLVDGWSRNLNSPPSLLNVIENWRLPIQGDAPLEYDSLGYDHTWQATPDVMSTSLCRLLYLLSRAEHGRHKYRLAISLATLAYAGHESSSLFEALLGFATIPELRALPMPQHSGYDLAEGYMPSKTILKDLVMDAAKDFSQCPEALLPRLHEEPRYHADERRRGLHAKAKSAKADDLVNQLIGLWPTSTVIIVDRSEFAIYFTLDRIKSSATTIFSSWFRNKQFKEFISRSESILNCSSISSRTIDTYDIPQSTKLSRSQKLRIDWGTIFSQQPPLINVTDEVDLISHLRCDVSTRNCHKVRDLIERGQSNCTGAYEKQYVDDMLRSLEHLTTFTQETRLDSVDEDLLRKALQDTCTRLGTRLYDLLEVIRSATVDKDVWTDQLAATMSIWPRLIPTSLLKHLLRPEPLGPGWITALLRYGELLTRWQYYRRLVALPISSPEFLKEFKNVGHVGWDPAEHPEWLIFEVENNLLIRPEQAQVAKEMLQPSCRSNCVMQLNMGEGKSSVIAPIVAATLAKGTCLPRMIVLPSLFAQMFHLLRQKLGGLLDHRVVGVPFSRSIPVTSYNAASIQEMYERLLRDRCVVLCQPEHILSFELMGNEKSINTEQSQLATTLVKTQRWLDENTRDILDESDEILNVKFELIYTMGIQNRIDFSPRRWEVVASVLRKLSDRLRIDAIGRDGQQSNGLNVQDIRRDGFPRLQILESEEGEYLMERVVYDLFTDGGVQGLPVWSLSPNERQVLIDYVLGPEASEPKETPALKSLLNSKEERSLLLLLKGLFGHGVLRFVFQHKRWRVNYGHDFSRSMLAVPYRAKDLPATRAEFSHPDVSILLTYLSYYYKGLADDQLFQCFDELLGSDDPPGEYATWTKEIPGIPSAFRELSGVNLKDRLQCIEVLFPIIRWAKPVIDFFISCLVFPKEMKEFPNKLSLSGWDIAQVKRHPTTGFSGTNDSRYLLPLSVQQYDIPDQVHTNATVLECLLLPHNTYQVIPGAGDAKALLDMVMGAQPEIRVILDVGALVLEWRNHEMARRWLSCVLPSQAEGVVYFDDGDELMVLTRDGRVLPLQESPMQKQMDRCLIYLDEAHTRGTDLKLPSNYRAAATLGIGLLKDRLVQACMRMRKLAHGQSVMLCAPAELDRKIRKTTGKTISSPIEVDDVLLWSIANTHHYTKKCVPLWATQGMRHQRRKVVWNGAGNAEALLEPEAKTLKDWYGAYRTEQPSHWMQKYGTQVLLERQTEVQDIEAKMKDFEASTVQDAAVHEEQERELSPESELERQLERPPKVEAAKHSLHPDLIRMIHHGSLDIDSQAVVPAFDTLSVTRMAADYVLSTWPSGLWVTQDFSRTIQARPDEKQDHFIRPPQWILRCPNSGKCIIISPFEADRLFSQIRKVGKISLHVYAPRVRDSMRAIDDLQYCAVPSQSQVLKTGQDSKEGQCIQIQLNLFAGQLFFASLGTYQSACRFLGLAFRGAHNEAQISIDGFINPQDRVAYDTEMAKRCGMLKSPVNLLRSLIACRRKGQGFKKSQVGLVLAGELTEVARSLA